MGGLPSLPSQRSSFKQTKLLRLAAKESEAYGLLSAQLSITGSISSPKLQQQESIYWKQITVSLLVQCFPQENKNLDFCSLKHSVAQWYECAQ